MCVFLIYSIVHNAVKFWNYNKNVVLCGLKLCNHAVIGVWNMCGALSCFRTTVQSVRKILY